MLITGMAEAVLAEEGQYDRRHWIISVRVLPNERSFVSPSAVLNIKCFLLADHSLMPSNMRFCRTSLDRQQGISDACRLDHATQMEILDRSPHDELFQSF
jgi:hypothetical protein